MTNWRSIETAPMDGTLVDLWIEADGARFRATDYRWTGTAWEYKHGGTIEYNFGNGDMRATHWHAIPVPPTRK